MPMRDEDKSDARCDVQLDDHGCHDGDETQSAGRTEFSSNINVGVSALLLVIAFYKKQIEFDSQ